MSSRANNSVPLALGCISRLFSTFPDGWPGLGLLLLRVGLSSHLIFIAISDLSARSSEPIALTTCLAAAVGGIFLLAGLWTPIMGALVAVDELLIALSLHSLRAGAHVDSHLLSGDIH